MPFMNTQDLFASLDAGLGLAGSERYLIENFDSSLRITGGLQAGQASPGAALMQAFSQVSDRTLLELANVVITTPDHAWLDLKSRDEARALTEFLAIKFAELGVN